LKDVLKNYGADLDESGIRDLMLSIRLKDVLKNYGADLDESGIRDLMLSSDIDNSGTIDYDEFAATTLHFSKVDREDRLFCAFSYFDKDGSGYITRVDYIHLKEIIIEVDQNNKILDTMGSWSTNGQSRPWMRETKFPNGSSNFLGNRAASAHIYLLLHFNWYGTMLTEAHTLLSDGKLQIMLQDVGRFHDYGRLIVNDESGGGKSVKAKAIVKISEDTGCGLQKFCFMLL
ncbi:calcium-dependent protein kinase 26-like protein, partial [Tanacetum coccineum]